MKAFYLRAMLLLTALVCLGACASTDDVASDNPVKAGGTVPGEKTSDEPMSATAGPGGAGAGVKW